MEKFQKYDIAFSYLKPGIHSFNMSVDQSFFDLFEFDQDFSEPKIEVNAELNKHSSFLELTVNISGTVKLVCDISDEKYIQSIKNSIKVLVKFGDSIDDSNEEILIIPTGSHAVNIAQLIFENVILSIPMKHLHPRYAKGYEDEYTKLLEKYSLPTNNDED